MLKLSPILYNAWLKAANKISNYVTSRTSTLIDDILTSFPSKVSRKGVIDVEYLTVNLISAHGIFCVEKQVVSTII